MNALEKMEDYDRLATAFENLRKELTTAKACAERKQREIDELAAMVEVKDRALRCARNLAPRAIKGGFVFSTEFSEIDKAISITGPAALAEVKAMTLEDAALLVWEDQDTAKWLERLAASIRKEAKLKAASWQELRNAYDALLAAKDTLVTEQKNNIELSMEVIEKQQTRIAELERKLAEQQAEVRSASFTIGTQLAKLPDGGACIVSDLLEHAANGFEELNTLLAKAEKVRDEYWIDYCAKAVANQRKYDETEIAKAREEGRKEAVPEWSPIETAPKDNKRPLLLARFNEDGTMQSCDTNGSWESDMEPWWVPQVYYYWASDNGNVEEPSHWMYQPDWLTMLAAAPEVKP